MHWTKIQLEITKLVWKVSVLKVNDREKLQLLKIIDSMKMIDDLTRFVNRNFVNFQTHHS